VPDAADRGTGPAAGDDRGAGDQGRGGSYPN